MNFYVAILIWKMEEEKQHFHHIMLYQVKKGKNEAEKQKKKKLCSLCSVWISCCDCQIWSVNFHIARFLLGDAPMSGGPLEIDSDHITY